MASDTQTARLLGYLPALVWTTDVQQRLTFIDGALCAELGIQPGQVIGQPVDQVNMPGAAGALAYERALHGKDVRYEQKVGERYFDIHIKPLHDDRGMIAGCFGLALDATENSARYQKVAKLSRIHAVLGDINTLIVRERNRDRLLQETCRIAVTQGGFMLAWAGLVEGEAVRPVAYYGDISEPGLDPILIGPDSPQAEGPLGKAVRENRPAVSNDVARDPDLGFVRERLLASGCRSLLVQPLSVGERVTACLVIHSNETQFFDDEEVNLLTGLAANIAYALEFIAREERLDYLTCYDPVTGLANRQLFSQRLDQIIQLAGQSQKRLAVLMIDLERFKAINDTLGLSAGDEVLRVVAQRLLQFAGSPNNLARIGADRFVAVIPRLDDAADLASILQEKIWQPLGLPIEIASQELRLAARVGIAVFPEDANAADSLISSAEAAMKKAKASGERYLFYTPHMGQAIAERLQLESRLRRALEHGEFTLHYQPKLDLQRAGILGVEALLRWESPEFGRVSPQRFVPLLEETGLVLEVGDWVMKQAARDHRQWQAQGLPAPRVAVNVSSLQLMQPGFLKTVKLAIGGCGPEGPGIDLEITESALMTEIETGIQKLKEVRQLGLEVSIDDFGTGYSSLAYLARLPVNTVKIDRSFVVAMANSAERMTIVSTIITLAHSLNLRVVAEGVDAQEQLRFLRLLRCDEIQGNLFSLPLPAGELAALLGKGPTYAL